VSLVCAFFRKFASLFVCSLSCFDRVIFKGYLPISRMSKLEWFVDRELKVLRKDFMQTRARQLSDRIVKHAESYAARHGRPFEFRRDILSKDDWALGKLRESPVEEGLVAVLCTMESCSTVKLVPRAGRPVFRWMPVPQRVVYYYFLDARLGLIHVRVQSWVPFTVQVYVNGHHFLARQMARRGVGFLQQDNAFVRLDDPARAQKLADTFATLPWPKILESYAKRVNPLLKDVLKDQTHYWVTDQAEYATDILFRSKQALQGLFPRMLEFAWLTFSPKDVLGFLGRRLHQCFDGEVLTDVKTQREPGARIKHRMKRNWLKMYDKFGLILRIETVINQPGEFKIFRECTRQDGTRYRAWRPMPKGVGNLHHYQRHARASNERYLTALSHVDDPTPASRDLANLTERKTAGNRSSPGFNPARQEDLRLFAAVLDGDHIPQGFRNKDLRKALDRPGDSHQVRRKNSAAIGRQLKRLHVRGLVAKIPHSRRWRITEPGRRILGDALRVYRRYWPNIPEVQAA
jgi:hypothetical protein